MAFLIWLVITIGKDCFERRPLTLRLHIMTTACITKQNGDLACILFQKNLFIPIYANTSIGMLGSLKTKIGMNVAFQWSIVIFGYF